MAFTKKDVIKCIVDVVDDDSIETEVDEDGFTWTILHSDMYEHLKEFCDLLSDLLDS